MNRDQEFLPEVRPVTLMEHGWRFFIATSTDSRKAQEMSAHPKAAALVHFRDGEYSGYLRIAGRVEVISSAETRQAVAEATGYPIQKYWETYDHPGLYFAEILPVRMELMIPGEQDARDISSEFPGADLPDLRRDI